MTSAGFPHMSSLSSVDLSRFQASSLMVRPLFSVDCPAAAFFRLPFERKRVSLRDREWTGWQPTTRYRVVHDTVGVSPMKRLTMPSNRSLKP